MTGEDQRIGIYDGIPGGEYHAESGSYSSTLIKEMVVPAKARHKLDNPDEYKECWRIGSAIHKYILERDDFHKEFLTGIDCGRRSNADKDEWAMWFYDHGADGNHIVSHKAPKWNEMFEAETDKHMVTPEEIKEIAMMSESVAANPDAMRCLEDGKAETSIYWQDEETGLNLKCRPDYMNSIVSDLKSCRSAVGRDFSRDAHRMGYHISQAMYQDGVQQVTGEPVNFLFVAVEKTPPYLCAVHHFDDESSELGYQMYRTLVRRLAECLSSQNWPGIPNELNLSLPRYAFTEHEHE